MAGNVPEWVLDRYGAYLTTQNLTTGSQPRDK